MGLERISRMDWMGWMGFVARRFNLADEAKHGIG